MELKSNSQIELARQFIHSTGANIFLTGRAGTGQTTFLRNTIQSLHKRVVVAAPTGVAAINAGGVTLHSLFQLPFSPHLPGMSQTSNENRKFRFRMGKHKIALIRSIELLVIDEISMVRCDMLDAIDETLRRVRRSGKPFGGVQLLMIGDISQLSPICIESEWELLREHYPTPYFFESRALRECGYITIELQEIFRQSDPHFTSLLNAVRDNDITSDIITKLNARYIPNFTPPKEEKYITLTTHNHTANRINSTQLSELPTTPYTYSATVKGEYPSSAYPNDEKLELKVGAQVIFIKNDTSPEKLYYNGLIGEITEATDTEVTIVPKEGGKSITVSAVTWDNIEYSLDPSTGEIREDIKGSFSQLPLRCAWAITIHKSQGLSFDRAIIDASSSFAHGQVYVALSRCRTLEGMVLSSSLSLGSIVKDSNIESFNQYVSSSQPDNQELERHQRAYICTTLCEIFDFERLLLNINSVIRHLSGHLYLERPELCNAFSQVERCIKEECSKFSQSFQRQIIQIVAEQGGDNALLHERLQKASQYFTPRITPLLALLAELAEVEPDAKELKMKLKEAYELLREEYTIKQVALNLCDTGFSIEKYQRAKVESIAQSLKEQPSKKQSRAERVEKGKKPTSDHDITHKKLYSILIDWRHSEAEDANIPAYMVLPNRSLIEIQSKLPQNLSELKKIAGIGTIKLKVYGEQIVSIVKDYCYDNDL